MSIRDGEQVKLTGRSVTHPLLTVQRCSVQMAFTVDISFATYGGREKSSADQQYVCVTVGLGFICDAETHS